MDFSKITRYLPLMIPAINTDTQQRDYPLICKRVALCASAIFAAILIAGQTLPIAIGVVVTTATLHTLAEIFRAKINPRVVPEAVVSEEPVVSEEQPNPEHMQELRLISELMKKGEHLPKPRRRRRKKPAPKKPAPKKIEPQCQYVYARGLYFKRGMNLIRNGQIHASGPKSRAVGVPFS